GNDSAYYFNYNGNLNIQNDLFATNVNQPVIHDGSVSGKTIYIEITPSMGNHPPVSTEIRVSHYPSSVVNITKN
ncbi:MAG: hypothetical protein K6T65_13125, partial [Peptococcaceae bacterium]|nr:hypothetical protein [Peptococcaceae bacterium]